MKPKISKQDGWWVLSRPAFGFGQPEVTVHDSWRAAVASLRSGPASAGASCERGAYTLTSPGQAGYPRRGTIRMEDT